MADRPSPTAVAGKTGPWLFAGRYRMMAQIGQGGAGRVFRAEHAGTGRHMAVKLLSPEGIEDDIVRARFLAEARVTTSIAHPHIVEMLDAGISDAGQPFVAMELLDGEPLSKMARRVGRVPWPVARDIVLQIAEGLGHAHAQGVIHRDIKPENIMVRALEGGQLSCKIIDFGLAHLKQQLDLVDWESVSGQPIGTAPTMSPEQIKGHEITASSDIYALGCVLFRLLAGRYPFRARTLVEFATAHLYSAPTPLPEVGLEPDIRGQVEHILKRCLAKDPSDRFPSMQALSLALRSSGDTEHIDAPGVSRPPGEDPPVTEPIPPAKSNRWQTLGLLVAGLVGGTVLASALHSAAPPSAQQRQVQVQVQAQAQTPSNLNADPVVHRPLKHPFVRPPEAAASEAARAVIGQNNPQAKKRADRRKPRHRARRKQDPQKPRKSLRPRGTTRANPTKRPSPNVVDELFDPFQ